MLYKKINLIFLFLLFPSISFAAITVDSFTSVKNEMGDEEWSFNLYIDGELFKEYSLPKRQFSVGNNPDQQKIEDYYNNNDVPFRNAFEHRKNVKFLKDNGLSEGDEKILKVLKKYKENP